MEGDWMRMVFCDRNADAESAVSVSETREANGGGSGGG